VTTAGGPRRELRSAPVLGIGQATLDRRVAVERFPEPDTKVETSAVLEEGGGPVATALVAAARLGAGCRIVAAAGDDAAGARIRDGLESEGVETTHLLLRPGCSSPFSFVVVEPGAGRRTIFWTRGDAAPLQPGDVPPGLVESAAALLIDGHQPEAQHHAAVRARGAGVPVVLDAGSLRPGTLRLLALADHAVVSERFAREWSRADHAAALRALRRAGAATAVITLGASGCVGLEGSQTVRVPSLEVEAEDTSGAGDVFHGAYVVGMLLALGLEDRLRLACAAAGLKCARPGPRRGIPGLPAALAAAGLRLSAPPPPASRSTG
jgi:ribokinase